MAFDLSTLGRMGKEVLFPYAPRDAMLYALAIGGQREELDYLYEGRGPKVLPSFALAPSLDPVMQLVDTVCEGNKARMHSGQTLVVHAALPASGSLRLTCEVVGIYDMGKHASVVVASRAADASSGVVYVEGEWTVLFPGEGGFGGAPPPPAAPTPTDGLPSWSAEQATSCEQALLYRLTGDINPLHADPEVAKARGFAAPILQGLCTFGYMLRAAIKGPCGGDPSRLASIGGQFRRPAFPGDVFVIDAWPLGDGKSDGPWAMLLRARDRSEPIITNARLTMR